MKKFSFLSIVFWASFCMLFVSLAGPMTGISNAKTSGPPVFAGEVVIQGSPASVPAGYKIKKVLPHANLVVVEVQMGKESDHVQSLRGKGHKAGLNLKYQASQAVNDPGYIYQWHLPAIQCKDAWDVSTGDGVIVAVLDTGLRTEGPDGIGCVATGIDIVNGDSDPSDDAGHGTHVSGTIAQTTNNGTGVAGVAYDACIMAVKILDASGSGSSADIADGIYYAVDNHAQVINMSLGINARTRTTSDPFIDDALDNANDNGVTVVCAAGNDSWRKNVSYPAIYPTTIAVGATDYNNNRAYYSNYGTGLDIMAPGGDVRYDLNDDNNPDGVLQETFDTNGDWGYWFYQGTSMACPHVTGVVALLYQLNSSLTPDEVLDVLNNTALDLGVAGTDSTYGHGLVQANNALLSIIPTECPDADGDGYYDDECTGGTDCDDNNDAINPGAEEVCDGIDNNCDGGIDDCCNDENACTEDSCDPVTEECVHDPINCDDGDACTIDSCDSVTGCANEPIDCDDGDACNGSETCDSIEGCQPGTPLVCDDSDVCNGSETCDSIEGCQPGTPLVCDDGDACTGTETCDPIEGCQAGTPLVCDDDGDFCTGTESCDPALGCVSSGDPCSAEQTCNEETNICEEAEADIVNITKAEYKADRRELKVEATSSAGSSVILTVTSLTNDYGIMTYDSRKGIFKLKVKDAENPGNEITVTSSDGGEDTAPVTQK